MGSLLEAIFITIAGLFFLFVVIITVAFLSTKYPFVLPSLVMFGFFIVLVMVVYGCIESQKRAEKEHLEFIRLLHVQRAFQAKRNFPTHQTKGEDYDKTI
jgi:hypothetical protein